MENRTPSHLAINGYKYVIGTGARRRSEDRTDTDRRSAGAMWSSETFRSRKTVSDGPFPYYKREAQGDRAQEPSEHCQLVHHLTTGMISPPYTCPWSLGKRKPD